jgi:spermidine/putrescine transport system permease protein
MAIPEALTTSQQSGGPPAQPAPSARRRLTPYLLLLPGIAWLAIFFAVPILTLASTSLQTRVPGAEVGVYTQTFRFANYVDALTEYYPHFIRAFLYAGIATVVALLIGYPLAYAIAIKAGRWKNLLLILVIAPFFTSFILRTIAWKQVLADEGPVVGVLKSVGLLAASDSLTATSLAVVAGITYNFLPFMTLPIYASLERVDPRLIEAASDLYANGFTGFRKVTLPLSMPGVVAGTLLTFIPAAGDFINAELLGTPRQFMIGNVIQSRYLEVADYPTAAALSFLLMAFMLAIVLVWARIAGTEALLGTEGEDR